MLIAIDGPAGAGKSTVARALARKLGFAYLDSGAMYRCVALLSLESPQQELAALAREARIELSGTQAGEPGPVFLNERDVSEKIRTAKVSEAASLAAADPGVRKVLVAKQREVISHGHWVAEGRDIGTVVAPDAELKIFLTADPRERASRRAAELGAKMEMVLAEQTLRDERDTTRAQSPLRAAPGAVTFDTTDMGIEEAVHQIAKLARDVLAAAERSS